MKILKRIVLPFVFIVAILSNAIATPPLKSIAKNGVYCQLDGGTNILQNQIDNDLNYRAGWNIGAGVGYRYGGWRLAVTASYLSNRMNTFQTTTTLNNAVGIDADLSNGKSTAQAYMLNGYYNFRLQRLPRVSPYAGLGAGPVWVRTDFNLRSQTQTIIGDTVVVFPEIGAKTDSALGYQVILGIMYYVKAKVSMFFEYRHLETAQISFYKEEVVIRSTPLSNTINVDQKGHYRNNLLNVGLQITF